MLKGSSKIQPFRVGSDWVPAGQVIFAIPKDYEFVNPSLDFYQVCGYCDTSDNNSNTIYNLKDVIMFVALLQCVNVSLNNS